MAMMLVTGASGFLGRHVVRLAAAEIGRGRLLTTSRGAVPVMTGVRHVAANLADKAGWHSLPDDVSEVLHLAAVIPSPGRIDDVRENVTMAEGLAKRIASWPELRRVVFASTLLVYGPVTGLIVEELVPSPVHPYAVAKLDGERIVSSPGVSTIVLRFSSIYGPGQASNTVVPTFVRRALEGEDLRLFGDGSRTQDFVFVDDAARAVLQSASATFEGSCNIGSGHATSMRELAAAVLAACASSSVVHTDPGVPETSGSVRISIDRARKMLGYAPRVSLPDGLRAMIAK